MGTLRSHGLCTERRSWVIPWKCGRETPSHLCVRNGFHRSDVRGHGGHRRCVLDIKMILKHFIVKRKRSSKAAISKPGT